MTHRTCLIYFSCLHSDLRFHHLHGKNARILNGGLTAQRPNAHGEFNDAIVISNRQLHEGEIFEVMIDKMVDRWSGSLEAGRYIPLFYYGLQIQSYTTITIFTFLYPHMFYFFTLFLTLEWHLIYFPNHHHLYIYIFPAIICQWLGNFC